jgi:hypothetical protein
MRNELLTSFCLYKLKRVPIVISSMVQKLKEGLGILPVSSAECERGFSEMNRQLTNDRNRLLPQTLRSVCLGLLVVN